MTAARIARRHNPANAWPAHPVTLDATSRGTVRSIHRTRGPGCAKGTENPAMNILITIAAGWLVLAIPTALAIGRAIRIADQRPVRHLTVVR